MASRAHHVTSMAATSSCCVVPVLVKTSAHYITHPALRTQWETEKQEKAHSQREKTEKEAQKATEDAAREARIRSEITTRTFSGALLTCSCRISDSISHPS